MQISYKYGYDPLWINQIMRVFNKTEMKRNDRSRLNKAFQASYEVVTVWNQEQIIGFGRMLSDGEMYSSIFDVVIDPDYQKKGIGKKVIHLLMEKSPRSCFYLTSTFGNEPFYSKLGFKKHKTAMASYPPKLKNSPYLEHS